MANMFRLLNANEIDARVGTAKSGGKGVSLLLYKDARCDQNILDEAVGPMNWQRSHSRDNANCTVSIWDEKKQQWISKEDTGTESKTEAEKGLASDSFKRACFNWGIGRELYSAPFIWIPGDPDKLKFEKFTVLEIGYDENREINKLAIADKSGVVVYRYGNTTVKTAPIKPEPIPEDSIEAEPRQSMDAWRVAHQGITFNPTQAISKKAKDMGMAVEIWNKCRSSLVRAEKIPYLKNDELTQEDVDKIGEAIQKYILDGNRITDGDDK